MNVLKAYVHQGMIRYMLSIGANICGFHITVTPTISRFSVEWNSLRKF